MSEKAEVDLGGQPPALRAIRIDRPDQPTIWIGPFTDQDRLARWLEHMTEAVPRHHAPTRAATVRATAYDARQPHWDPDGVRNMSEDDLADHIRGEGGDAFFVDSLLFDMLAADLGATAASARWGAAARTVDLQSQAAQQASAYQDLEVALWATPLARTHVMCGPRLFDLRRPDEQYGTQPVSRGARWFQFATGGARVPRGELHLGVATPNQYGNGAMSELVSCDPRWWDALAREAAKVARAQRDLLGIPHPDEDD